MSEEIREKLLEFLSGEIAKKGPQQCVRIDLVYAQPQCREEELRRWAREADPELFENLLRVEKLIAEIIELAESHTDSFGQGKHRFVVRTHQHIGGRSTRAFLMSPAATIGGTEQALVPAAGGSSTDQILSQNNQALMRVNQQMFQSSFGTLATLAERMRDDNAKLLVENQELRRENAELKSNQLEKEFSIFERTELHKQKAQGFNALMQVGTVVAAKLTGGSGPVGPAPLVMLLGKFGESLREDQGQRLMSILDGPQKMMFMEIMNLVAQDVQRAQQEAQQQQGAPNGANGAPHA